MSLSRLWHQQCERYETRELLADSDGWFTEGFDTADLQEAKTLLYHIAMSIAHSLHRQNRGMR